MRDNLVRQRVDVISAVRFTLKSMGVKLRSPNTTCFARHARRALEEEHSELLAMIEPSLQVIDAMTEQVRSLERAIERLACEEYPETEFLRQIPGVGVLTALSFVLIIGDPQRFK